ncbi:accessory factor UbiK family protein [Candidatus Riesia pediculicola]|uniref:accessory factor UbiK family protein n=1 Tax=Candidatus Riesia pediculicola TaxID=401619 RepID=UPI001FA9388B|nr:accessory factor UbiK family protein [Candidatus Riesia pediculicola]
MISRILLEEIRNIRKEIEDKVKFIVSKQMERLQIVSKEEYEVQSEILSNIVKKVSNMEKRIRDLERKTLKNSKIKKK